MASEDLVGLLSPFGACDSTGAAQLPRPKAAQINEGTNGIVPEIPNVLGRPPPSKHQLSSEDARGIGLSGGLSWCLLHRAYCAPLARRLY